MGFEDPVPLADRLAEAAAAVRAHIEYCQTFLLLPEDEEGILSEYLHDVVEHLDAQLNWLHRIIRDHATERGIGFELPVTDLPTGRRYGVNGMPVHAIRPYARPYGMGSFADYVPPPAEAEIVIYLDKYNDYQLEQIQAAAARLGNELGYADFILTDEQTGSIFRRWTGKLATGFRSDYVQQKMQELDARASIEISGRARAETDAIRTSSVVSLIASLADIPNAVVRVGGILIVKHTGANGMSAVITRELSTREVRALELNPGIQKDPHAVFQLLAVAVAQLEEDEQS